MPRPSNRDQRRRDIRKAMLTVMARKGYEGATIQDIASQAGLAPGLLHYHYESKRAILLDLLDRMSRVHERRLDAAVSQAGDDAMDQLQALLDVHLDFRNADPDALASWIALTTEAMRDAEVREHQDQVMAQVRDRIRTVLRAAKRQGYRTGVDDASVIGAITALIQGYFVVAATSPKAIVRGSAAPVVRSMMRAWMRKND